MFCTNCGQKIEDGMKFCPNCGQPVTPETSAAANASALGTDDVTVTNASALGTEAAATANASALGTDDAAAETVETAAASAAPEDTTAAADVETSAESATAGPMDEASAAPAADPASEMPAETAAGSTTAETPLGNTTEQYKRRLEEGHAASGTEGNTSGAAQQTPPPVNHGPAVNGIPSEPDGNGTIRTVGLILLILTVLFAVPQIWSTIASFFRIIQNLFSFSYHGFVNLIYSFLNFILNVVKLAGYGFIGGGLYLVWKKWSDRDAEPLLMTVIAGGVVLVLEALLRGIISAIFQRYYAIGSASWGIGFAILAIVLLVVLITQKQLNPFAGLSGNLADGLRRDLDRVTDLAQGKNSATCGGGYDTNTFGGSDAQQAAGANAADAKAYGAAADSIGAQTGTAGQTTADADGNFNRYYQSQSQPGGGYTGPLKTDRSLVLYILLGFLTCGIYQLYVFYTIMRDVNVACDGDGRHTPGLLEFILFGILTCGIYDLYWFYSVGNRLADNAPRYGLRFQENGTTLLLWMLIGSLLCFIGSYVGIYFLLNNVNAICNAYNQQRS